MIELYYNLVINQKRTCDETNLTVVQVPIKYRADVILLLSERGFDINGYRI